MSRARRPARYDDLLQVPDTMVAEILDGELVTNPRPATPHAHASIGISIDIGGAFRGPPGAPPEPDEWWILVEPEVHLGSDVLVPDLAGWRRGRLAVLPSVAAMTQAPDWACEVISPSTGAIDRGRKMRIYAREGVGHLWLVDPIARTLEVYRLEDGRWIVAEVYGGDGAVRAEPFAAIEVVLARWWLPPEAAR
jgi:Uma2 family endonuclease